MAIKLLPHLPAKRPWDIEVGMTSSFGRQTPVRALVRPITSHQKTGINGTAAGNDDRAFLSPVLSKHLLGSASRSQLADGDPETGLYIAVEWPVDRRLEASAARTLVVVAEERDFVSTMALEKRAGSLERPLPEMSLTFDREEMRKLFNWHRVCSRPFSTRLCLSSFPSIHLSLSRC